MNIDLLNRSSALLLSLMLMLGFASVANAQCGADETDSQEVANEIADGHAFRKHVIEQREFQANASINGLAFPNPSIITNAEFATLILAVIQHPSKSKPLANDRRAYWHANTGTIVIYNKHAADCGTAFRPTAGDAYYNGLR